MERMGERAATNEDVVLMTKLITSGARSRPYAHRLEVSVRIESKSDSTASELAAYRSCHVEASPVNGCPPRRARLHSRGRRLTGVPSGSIGAEGGAAADERSVGAGHPGRKKHADSRLWL